MLEYQNATCFVLPSIHEQWGLVIHEAAIAGLPILCTETCGAAPHFVINHYSGFRVKDDSAEDLQIKLETIINMTPEELVRMGKNSHKLSQSISLEIQIANILQLIR
ncbi:Glycosyl transferases group 1 [compost metagenome]